MIKNIRNNL